MYNTQKILINELNHLRNELLNLKKCQITFFTLSISATALLLGITFKFDKNNIQISVHHIQLLIFLSPLIVLLPSWWVIFDKATTITRIVGYYRIIESILINNIQFPLRYIGWENALREFRKMQNQNRTDSSNHVVQPKDHSIIKLFLLHRTAHSFWVIIWWTYFILSLLCISISFLYLLSVSKLNIIDIIIVVNGLIAFSLSSFVTARMVWHLVYGRYSYDANENMWFRLLRNNNE